MWPFRRDASVDEQCPEKGNVDCEKMVKQVAKKKENIMATVEDHQTGEICEMVKMAFILLDASNGSLKDSEQGLGLLAAAKPFEPKKCPLTKQPN